MVMDTFIADYRSLDFGEKTIKEYFDSFNYSNEFKQKYENYFIHYYEYRELNKELLNLIPVLKNNGYNVYLLSDNNKEAIEYWYNLPEFSNVDGYVVSSDYKEVKRDKKLFDIFFEKYNLVPAECYFVDDKSINIEVAKEFNMEAFQYASDKDDLKNLITDMKDKGINI